jgi:ADP-L-glycero-D-manno-heptose 6-epimerase
MILVTGGFGLIGSNIIRNLNKRGKNNIFVVDDLTDGRKYKNLVDCEFDEYFDKDTFFENAENLWDKITAIYHEGAISSTTEWNGKKVMESNYFFSDKLLAKAMEHKIPFSYASSASVYGGTLHFTENGPLDPMNMYAYSKMLFDRKIEKLVNTEWYQNSPYIIQGWRYFNVYGQGEDHKDGQASPITQFSKQAKETGKIKVFEGSEKFKRDFVCAEDIALLKIEMLNRKVSGIFNAGTGNAISFMDVANMIARKVGAEIETIPFPEHLKGHYQEFTQANMDKLTTIGNPIRMRRVQDYINHNV